MRLELNPIQSVKVTILSLIVPMIVFSEGGHASVKDVHEIIDICTSSERIMKDYAMMGMKITYHDPKKDLEINVKKIEKELIDLESHDIAKELHDKELKLHEEWKKIVEELKETPTKEGALTLHHHINTFAHHCEELAEELAADTGIEAEHDVVLIARLNLDVQELAAAYIMHAWGAIPDEEYYNEVKTVLEDYEKAYNELIHADVKLVSEKVKGHLKILHKHFRVLEFMAESKSGRYVPLLIAKKAEKIYEETTNILKLEESEVEK